MLNIELKSIMPELSKITNIFVRVCTCLLGSQIVCKLHFMHKRKPQNIYHSWPSRDQDRHTNVQARNKRIQIHQISNKP